MLAQPCRNLPTLATGRSAGRHQVLPSPVVLKETACYWSRPSAVRIIRSTVGCWEGEISRRRGNLPRPSRVLFLDELPDSGGRRWKRCGQPVEQARSRSTGSARASVVSNRRPARGGDEPLSLRLPRHPKKNANVHRCEFKNTSENLRAALDASTSHVESPH